MEGSKVGERLAERPASEVVKHLYEPRIAEELAVGFEYMTAVNLAHVVMLAERRIIAAETARALLGAIQDIAAAGPGGLELDPEREDLYFNYEYAVISRVGAAAGGQMHTGRSRNDLGATTQRLRFRDVLLGLIPAALDCRRALLRLAGEHAGTVMPGYTHLQPAQPITLGHYLTAVESALTRNTARLWGAMERCDLSPLGAAALAGTGFPISRERTAGLLGFPGLVVNTLDAVASRDFLLEAVAAGAIMGATLSRFVQDLYVWYTSEFGMIDFRDRAAGTSSIMPQKRNPILLENIRGKTAQLLGAAAGAIAGVRNTPFTNLIDANREGLRPAWAAVEELRVSLVLAQAVVDNVVVRPELMVQRCRDNFSTVTELADTLVREWGISFREAHEVVGRVVRKVVGRGGTAAAITSTLVSETAGEVLGVPRELDGALVAAALDPAENVARRATTGGPAPERVREMVKAGNERLAEETAALDAVRQRIASAQRRLAESVEAILRG